ncbi:MAG TPA: GspE/PulE family protein [Candidatus Saccharimonadales bacterium]|nr:GspE/PulE family protein [Candidatus Saccharimonadales bacterium]
MHIPDGLVEKLLKGAKKITDDQLTVLREQEVAEKKPLQELVIQSNIVSDHDLTKMYAEEIDIPFADLNPHDISHDLLALIPEKMAQQYRAVVFGVNADGSRQLAMEDPDDIQAVSFLQKQVGGRLAIYAASSTSISAALDLYHGNDNNDLTKVLSPETDEDNKDDEVSEADLAEDSPITQTVNLLIRYAVKSGASDIHIEPRENYVSVRYRVDGVLREANKLPKKIHNAVVSRIKILSNLKIDERRVPQDGRFKIEVDGLVYALRVSTLPISDGEKIVMRILNESNKAITFQELGFWGPSLELLNQAITQPHGMILVTGPTGSGKSTTLFSVLNILNKPSVNISTIEDPIEYKVFGTNQTQVNPVAGMTFASGLRSLLRQDPNIIMVGEIRDRETADLAVQAALTGHLVFSTLHTNNAATSLPRLLDMGIEPFLIASTVRAVIGQRLVRVLCGYCREEYAPDEAVLKQLSHIFQVDNPEVMQVIHDLEKQAQDLRVTQTSDNSDKQKSADLSSTETGIKRLWRVHEGGCDQCNHTGYKGRVGIYEALPGSTAISKLIVAGATSEDIQTEAIKEGMVTMQLDGFIKSLRGITTIEEILRVTVEK